MTECWILRAENGAPLLIFTGSPSPEWRAKHLTGGQWLEHVQAKPIDAADLARELASALELLMPDAEYRRALEEAAYGRNYNRGKTERLREGVTRAKSALAKVPFLHGQ